MLEELKQCFLEAYDDNKDGKIEIREVRNRMLYFDFGNTHDKDRQILA